MRYNLIRKTFSQPIHYGVILAISRDDKLNTLKYEVKVNLISRKGDSYVFEIERLPLIFINEEEADLVADQLAIQTSAVLYPLQIVVSADSEIIGIQNFSEIQNRWKEIKQNILKYNKGEILEKYIRLTESSLKNEDGIVNSIRNDWFLNGYFNNLYHGYDSSLKSVCKIYLPFIFDTDSVEYEVDQKITLPQKDNSHIKIIMEGKSTDERSSIDLENGLNYASYTSDEKTKGEYKAQYLLDPNNNSIIAFSVDAKIELEQTRGVSIVVSKIEKEHE